MNGFDDDLYDEEDELEEREFHYRRRDTKVDEAKTVLANELFIDAGAVYYGQQIEVLYEQRFFHWITARALTELANEGQIRRVSVPLTGYLRINFYSLPSNRYWKRRANKIAKLGRAYYIPRIELITKIEMCEHFGLRPLFILRYAPKNISKSCGNAAGLS